MEGDVLIFTAQGREGHQQLLGRNKRLVEQYTAPVPIYGFMNTGRQNYLFLGLLELMRHYPESQADIRRTLRRVWLFEFRVHNEPAVVPLGGAAAIMASLLEQSRRRLPTDLEREVADAQPGHDPAVEPYAVEAVRSRLIQVQPYEFEHLIRDLMASSGFRDGVVTAMSGDGGIDINAYVEDSSDFFAGTHVQVQVKRWRHAVGSIEINQFRGALSTTAKGIFVTTSHYTRAAVVEANHPSKLSVTLIDGPRLSSMMIRTGLVST